MKFFALVLFLALLAPSVQAQETVVPPETTAKQAILVDAQTGTVLFAKDADVHMPTSSMCKIMTMYLVFEGLKTGKLHMDDTLPVSSYAWKQEGSRMFLNPGNLVKVEDLIRGVVIQSGNDASVVFAEALGGSEASFAGQMNAKAKELGMANSHFMNATGMPDPDHYSTARDLATLGIALIRDFPDRYRYFSEIEYSYNNIKQGNRNPLLYRNIGADGIKTGHTESGGFGLVASTLREGRRLVLVINGLESMQDRADEPTRLIEWGYREFGTYPVVKAGKTLGEAKVWLGEQATVPVVASKDVVLTLPRRARDGLQASVVYDEPIRAPIAEGQVVGKVVVTAPGFQPVEAPLVAGARVNELGFFARSFVKVKALFGQ